MPKKIVLTQEQEKDLVNRYSNNLESFEHLSKLFRIGTPRIINILRSYEINIEHIKTIAKIIRTKQQYINHPELRKLRAETFSKSNKGKSPWCKGLTKEEFLKHYDNGETWNKGLTGDNYKSHFKGEIGSGYRKGKTYEELYGKDKAEEMKRASSIYHKNHNNSETLKRLYKEKKIKPSMLGKHHTKETKERLSIIHQNPSEETRKKLREHHWSKRNDELSKRLLKNLKE